MTEHVVFELGVGDACAHSESTLSLRGGLKAVLGRLGRVAGSY